MQNSRIVLYASYQTGPELPGYVRFALQHLSETPFRVVLLTNKRELSPETLQFLGDHNIFLYLTENHGFDFGMWRRFLKDLAAGKGSFTTLSGISRLVLMNDSVVYYRNRFQEFFDRAERSDADAISLTQSEEVRSHLQSFFLYLKQEALGAFFMHLLETPEQENFYDVVHRLEIGMAQAFEDAEVRTEVLYPTRQNVLFAYPELIAAGAGFIKRKLLQHRFSVKEKMFFVKNRSEKALNMNYHELIIKGGYSSDFKEEWLPAPVAGTLHRAADTLWEKPLEKLGVPLYNRAKKLFGKTPDSDKL
jgi:lipopolysaccharide biosynthesis protein